MGQYEVLDILKRERRWMRPRDIAEVSKITVKRAATALRNLRRWDLVDTRIRPNYHSLFGRENDLEYRAKKDGRKFESE